LDIADLLGKKHFAVFLQSGYKKMLQEESCTVRWASKKPLI